MQELQDEALASHWKEVSKKQMRNEHLRDASVAGSIPASQSTSGAQGDGQLMQLEILQQKVTERLNQVEERVTASTRNSTPEKQKLSLLKVRKPNLYQVVRPRAKVMNPPLNCLVICNVKLTRD